MTDIRKPPFKNLLITGAAGALGSVLREALIPYTEVLTLSDRAPLGKPRPNERHFVGDLADRDLVFEMMQGVDVVIHLGGAPRENTF
ncbi:MAG: Uronate dehydrogenase [Burkholderia plantarii]|nr:MAG: Uronate dehydrogenase [Burkholderia plantarii]